MKRLYLTTGGILSPTPGVSTPGSLFVGEFLEFEYDYSPQEVLAAGDLKVEFLTNASGSIEISPTVFVREISGPNIVETQVWTGVRKAAGVGTVLSWDGTHNFQRGLVQAKIVLRIAATGTTGASATLGVGEDAFFDIDVREGTPVEQDFYTKGIFYLFKRRESRIIWTRGDVKQHVEKGVYTKGGYHAQHIQEFFTRSNVRSRRTSQLYTRADLFEIPPPGSPAIKNLRIGEHALSETSDVVETMPIKERLDAMDPVPAPPTVPDLPEVPPSLDPLTKAAESLLSASEFLRGELIPTVAGNVVEVYFPSDPAESDLVLVDGEWRLPDGYNTSVTYELPLPSHTTLNTLRVLILGLRQKPSDALITPIMNGVPGRKIMQKDISPFEDFSAWAWVDPQPRTTNPKFFPVLGVTNPTGSTPGFRGTGAALLVS